MPPSWDTYPLVLDLKAHPVRSLDGAIYLWVDVPGRTHAVRRLDGDVWLPVRRVSPTFAAKLEKAELPAGVRLPE